MNHTFKHWGPTAGPLYQSTLVHYEGIADDGDNEVVFFTGLLNRVIYF